MLTLVAPFNNYLPILSFKTQVLSKIDSNYYDVCIGSTITCQIPMTVLRLTYGY